MKTYSSECRYCRELEMQKLINATSSNHALVDLCTVVISFVLCFVAEHFAVCLCDSVCHPQWGAHLSVGKRLLGTVFSVRDMRAPSSSRIRGLYFLRREEITTLELVFMFCPLCWLYFKKGLECLHIIWYVHATLPSTRVNFQGRKRLSSRVFRYQGD